MNLAPRCLLTSLLMALCSLGLKFLFFYWIGLNAGSTFSLWVITFGKNSGQYVADQANMLALQYCRNSTSCSFISFSRRLPICIVLIGSSSLRDIKIVFFTGSPYLLGSLWSSWSRDNFFNFLYYIIKHCRASY